MRFLALAAVLGATSQEAAVPPFQVPDGFVIELVAGPPLVERPILAAFDDRGRLYVADSAGVNLKGAELLKDPPHRIRLLEDTDGDGRFDASRVFADKLVFPQGLLWHDGAVYTTSPPGFWKLEDLDGDGICDRRTELLTGFANTGVADDAHGACLGPDGRIYFLPGRMAHALRKADGTPVRKAVGPWLMRMRPDGSDVEIVSGCQGNPVEVDWLPEGDFFISGTFWAPDSFGGGLRDCLVHGVEGGEYAVRDRVYADRKRTGDFLPALVPMAATAPSGMMIARSPGFEGNLFCAYFNTRKVQRHGLERDGATFRARTEEFVSSSHPDFHPTDVLEDADGSILVVDTGGWFRIGCPTSQIAKPQVLGGIYRVRRKGAPAVSDPRGLALDWKSRGPELEARLDDPRFAVRERAMHELGKSRHELKPDTGSRRARQSALWALTRRDGPEARAAVRRALDDPDPAVRQVAAASAGLHRDPDAAARLMGMAVKDEPAVRREAATALGRIGDRKAVPALLESVRRGGDRFLEHAVLFALIRLGDREATMPALKDPSGVVRRAALVALDQMDEGKLTPDLVTPLLDPADATLQQAALKVILSRPGWSREIHELVRRWMSEPRLDDARRELLQGVLVAFSRESPMQEAAVRALRDETTSVELRLLILEAMARAPLERVPAIWLAEARWSLDHPDERVARQAVAMLRAASSGDFDGALVRMARDEARSPDLRVEALTAVAPRLPKLDPKLYEFLTDRLDPKHPPLMRLTAAEALGKAALDDAQLRSLAPRVGKAGALEMPRLVAAYERSRDAGVGRRLLEALSSAAAIQSIPGDSLRRILRAYPEEIRRQAEPILKKLDGDGEEQKRKMAELEPLLAKGSGPAGREVFLGRKAGCTACHRVAGQGGTVGPDLSKIGSIRSGRDLLEAVVFPSATFARGFEPFLIRTQDGGIHDGLIARETPDAIYLFTAERTEKRIARAQVDAIQQSRVSVMPQGLDAQLTREELRDLIAYLSSLK